jgi:hypothetical protein
VGRYRGSGRVGASENQGCPPCEAHNRDAPPGSQTRGIPTLPALASALIPTSFIRSYTSKASIIAAWPRWCLRDFHSMTKVLLAAPRAAVLCCRLTQRRQLSSSTLHCTTTPVRRPRRLTTAMAAAPKPIPKRKLGSSDLMVSTVCLGTMTFGTAGSAHMRARHVADDATDDASTTASGVQNTEAEGHQQLDYYVKERGCNFIDTVRPSDDPGQMADQHARAVSSDSQGSGLTPITCFGRSSPYVNLLRDISTTAPPFAPSRSRERGPPPRCVWMAPGPAPR